MNVVFYLAGAVAVVATVMVITRLNAVHALLYLIVSLLAVAVVFYTLGAAFVAALEVIIYAGAIMVLFLFASMMLNLANEAEARQRLFRPATWVGPALLAAILLAELVWVLVQAGSPLASDPVQPQAVGAALFGPYMLGAELASFLLLAGLVGAYHLGRRPGVSRGRRA